MPTKHSIFHYEKKRLFKFIENFTTKKMKTFRWKILVVFIFLLINIDCGYSLEPPRRGGSNEYPQSMFVSRNKKINVFPCNPQFYRMKVGLRGSKLYRRVFAMWFTFGIHDSLIFLLDPAFNDQLNINSEKVGMIRLAIFIRFPVSSNTVCRI